MTKSLTLIYIERIKRLVETFQRIDLSSHRYNMLLMMLNAAQTVHRYITNFISSQKRKLYGIRFESGIANESNVIWTVGHLKILQVENVYKYKTP